MTVDVEKFSYSIVNMYSNIAKPTLDVILYNYQLSQNVGFEVLFILNVFLGITSRILRQSTPPFGKFVAREQKAEVLLSLLLFLIGGI